MVALDGVPSLPHRLLIRLTGHVRIHVRPILIRCLSGLIWPFFPMLPLRDSYSRITLPGLRDSPSLPSSGLLLVGHQRHMLE